jgi:hypothetical protein
MFFDSEEFMLSSLPILILDDLDLHSPVGEFALLLWQTWSPNVQ